MKRNILFLICICTFILTGCGYDNFDEPTAFLSGKVVYDGKPVGIRSHENNAPQFQLYQDGYAKFDPIPVYISHDGSYSVNLFNGQYKLVRRGGAPWDPQLNDTIVIDVKGRTNKDIPVTPYFVINNESFQGSSSAVTAKFSVNKIVESAELAGISLFLGKSILTDNNNHEQSISADIANVNLNQDMTMTINITDDRLVGLDYVFARIGVLSNITNEYYFTQVQKVNLK